VVENATTRLLVVEDEERLRDPVKQALQEAGFTVDAPGSAGAADSAIELLAYDAVVLDLPVASPGCRYRSLNRNARARRQVGVSNSVDACANADRSSRRMALVDTFGRKRGTVV
jgi:DNA-binding response OmpR family regulator